MFNQSTKKDQEAKPLTYWEKRALEKQAEAKKKMNVMMSRRSAEASSGSGGSGYSSGTAKFASGAVQSRSRVGLSGSDEGESNPFNPLKKEAGFAKKMSKGGSFAQNLGGDKKDLDSNGGRMGGAPKRPLGF
jgi:hypothetical protein